MATELVFSSTECISDFIYDVKIEVIQSPKGFTATYSKNKIMGMGSGSTIPVAKCSMLFSKQPSVKEILENVNLFYR